MTELKTRGPAPTDIHVGKRIKLRRTMLSVSQHRLAAALGLTFQQIQKYEAGTNRVSASKLYDIAKALEVEISFFFEELPPTAKEASTIADPMKSEIALRLVNVATRRLSERGVDRLLSFLENLPPPKADLAALSIAAE